MKKEKIVKITVYYCDNCEKKLKGSYISLRHGKWHFCMNNKCEKEFLYKR